MRKSNYFYLFSLIGIIYFLGYSISHFFNNRISFMTYVLLFCAFSFIANIIFFIFTKKIFISSLISILISAGLIFFSFFIRGVNNFRIIWIFVIPFLVFYFQGRKAGFIILLSILLLSGIILFFNQIKIINIEYSYTYFIDIYSVFVIISLMAFFNEFKLNKNEEIISKHYFSDPLTKLPNRKQLKKDLICAEKLILYLININRFKDINLLYGSRIGDLTLLEIAHRLKTIKNKYLYKIYKLHADEFAIIFKNPKSDFNSLEIIKVIQQLILTDFIIENHEITISSSIGISESSKDLLANTDIALKYAKRNNKDYAFYEGSMKFVNMYYHNIAMLNKLRLGIALDNIVPFYQPIFHNKNNTIDKYECLARLISDNEIYSPYVFLDIAKKARMYPYITRLIILKSFRYFKDHKHDFSINISIDDILNKDTVSFIYSLLQDYNVSNQVIFELIESDKFEEKKEVFDFITKIKKLGCKIAIDDFGTGYSNFNYILNMNIDYLKIDASLIKKLDVDANSQIITENIVNLTKKLNIKTIAEFVHSNTVLEKVKDFEIDYSQGYYLGEPKIDINK